MPKIKELKNQSHVFTLTDGSTFRVFPLETSKELKASLISAEIRRAEEMRLIHIEEYEEKPFQNKVKGV